MGIVCHLVNGSKGRVHCTVYTGQTAIMALYHRNSTHDFLSWRVSERITRLAYCARC